MGNIRQFNFDLYVDELLTEALSLIQMQDQIKQVGLDATKYDQKHLLFLVGLINSNQGIEIYDELLNKVKDKGLLNALLSVSVNDRRSDKPTIDLEKVERALANPDDPNELRAIIAGQRRAIPAGKEEPEYNADELKQFLSLNRGLNLFDILVKIRPELDASLKQFLSEYNNEASEVQEFLKTNAQRAKTVQDLIAILHEGHTKNINPYNSTTSLTIEDLQNGALFSNEEEHLYIIRTTYQDDFNKSIRWNLKYGQGNRFGLCISSRTNNYYVDYRTGEMGGSPLTTYFVYKLYDKNLDPKDINNYEIAIVDAMGEPVYSSNYKVYSFNKVATVVGRSQNAINSADQLKWNFSNIDVPDKTAQQTVVSLRHLFVGDIIVNGKDGKAYDFALGFEEIFKSIPLGEKEKNAKALLQRFDAENFLSFKEGEQMALLRSGEIINSINIDILKKLSPQVRMQYVQLANLDYKDIAIYNEFTEEERNQYNKKVIKKIHEKIDKRVNNQGIVNSLTNFDYIINDNPISILEYQIAITDPKLREIYVDLVEENNKKFREAILEKVDANGVYKGNIIFVRSFTDDFAKQNEKDYYKTQRFFPSRYVLPDLSDIIVDGDFIIGYRDLISLKGCPKIVTGKFACDSNHITSLEGGPRAAFTYSAFDNELTSLKGAPKYVFLFNVASNNLTTLEHSPLLVGGNFSANSNKLISLKGCPKIVGGDFVVSYNKSLESLEHGPEIVGVEYLFHQTNLKTLNGLNFKKGYAIDPGTIREYQKLFDELNMDREDMNEKTDLTQEDKRLIEEMKNETSGRIQEEISKAKQEYKAKKQINKESLLYNLMKSFLLKS